jgi:hypothetical protein
MSDGLQKYIRQDEPLLVLFEDTDIPGVRFLRKPLNRHLLSTFGLLRGLERVGVITSADAVIPKTTHPSDPSRRPRILKVLPKGTTEPALVGRTWTP